MGFFSQTPRITFRMLNMLKASCKTYPLPTCPSPSHLSQTLPSAIQCHWSAVSSFPPQGLCTLCSAWIAPPAFHFLFIYFFSQLIFRVLQCYIFREAPPILTWGWVLNLSWVPLSSYLVFVGFARVICC